MFVNLKKKHLRLIIGFVVFLHSGFFIYWIMYDPSSDLFAYTTGMDKDSNYVDTSASEIVIIGEHFNRFSEYKSALTGKWTKFRGAKHDNIIKTSYKINENWKAKDPKVLWSVETGEGHAAPVIYNGLMYFIDYDEKEKADMLRCFSLETGEEVWRRWYNVLIKRNHGLSRTIPAVSEKFIVTIGPRGHVMCVARETGDFIWGIDLEKKYDSKVPDWYTGQCPVIENDTAVIAVGGSSLLIGVDCSTGDVIWETPNPDHRKMSHSSILPATIDNKRMYIYAGLGSISGISAENKDVGKILWETIEWAPNVVAPSPVLFDENKIFMTAGYGAGSTVIEIIEKNGKFEAKTLLKYEPKFGLASEQQTPLLYKNHLYGILPKDAGFNRNQFVCYNINNLEKPVWQSGKTNRFGLGPYMILNDKILILNDEGTLNLIDASLKQFKLISQKKLFEGHDAWGPFAFADGYLLLRDSKNIYCLDLRP